jgi:1,4-dihydroxy-2-naphthoate octaprenyltransferase
VKPTPKKDEYDWKLAMSQLSPVIIRAVALMRITRRETTAMTTRAMMELMGEVRGQMLFCLRPRVDQILRTRLARCEAGCFAYFAAMSSLKPWILAARPKTLGAAIAPVLVGSVLGWKLGGQFCVWLMLDTLAACMCLQIATNLFNDALDSLKGSDTKARIGPVRITASGMMPTKTVLGVAVGVLALAAALSVPLIWYRGWPIVAIGIPSLYFCFGYTGGPWPLAYRGLGEFFVVLFFGLVAVTGSAYVQSGHWYGEALVAGLQVGMLSTVLIAINNLRDIEEDTKTGKRTLAVRFGKTFARWEIRGLMLSALLLSFFWISLKFAHDERFVLGGMLTLFALLLAIGISRDVKHEPSAVLNKTLAKAGAMLMLFSVLFCVGLMI